MCVSPSARQLFVGASAFTKRRHVWLPGNLSGAGKLCVCVCPKDRIIPLTVPVLYFTEYRTVEHHCCRKSGIPCCLLPELHSPMTSPGTIAMVLGVVALAALWAFKDKLCPSVPEWWGMPGWFFPCWWYDNYCQRPAQAPQLPPQQAQSFAVAPVATMAVGPVLSTPQPVPVAMAVHVEGKQRWG